MDSPSLETPRRMPRRGIPARFEHLIDPFQVRPDAMPPDRVVAFYIHSLRQVWPVLPTLMIVGLAGPLVKVALFDFVARIVDLARRAPRETISNAWAAFGHDGGRGTDCASAADGSA